MAMRFKLYPNELPHTSGKAMKTTSRLYDDLYKRPPAKIGTDYVK